MNRIINGFYEFQNNGYFEFGKVIDFCFVNNILEKVVVDVIINKDDFIRDNSNDKSEEQVFTHPKIPYEFEIAVNFLNPNKYSNQCKD